MQPRPADEDEAVITCPKCTKDNQDHYKFCLGCGAELPRDTAPKPFSPQTPSHGVKAVAANAPPQVSAPPQQPSQPPAMGMGPGGGAQPPAAGAGTVICPQCSHVNAPSNLFCGS